MPYKDPKVRQTKQKTYASTYYEKNKATVLAATKKSVKKYKDQWRDYKATLSCVKCGQNHPATFDFHHVDRTTKEASINKLIKYRAFKQAMEEVKKCIVLCANCHRIHHHDERIANRNKKAKKKKGTKAP
jgi:hypothetical protein